MTLFASDIEAAIYLLIVIGILFVTNKIIKSFLNRSSKITIKRKSIVNFSAKIISLLITILFIVEGFPAFQSIDPTYRAILTGSISTAIAFASSDIFSNFVTGIVLLSIGPMDVGDIVKIKGEKGVIRTINLTKVVTETFDSVMIEQSNSEIFQSTIANYTIRLKRLKDLDHLKKKVLSCQEIGFMNLKRILVETPEGKEYDDLESFFQNYSKKKNPPLHLYTFRMHIPYSKFRIRINEIEKICIQYKEVFGFKPRYYIVDLSYGVVVQFRIITTDVNTIFDRQPDFAEEIYKIVFSQRIN